RSLVFDYVAASLYEGDAPLAERRAQALALDRTLLRELIGGGELRELLDRDVLDEVEAELQQLAPDRRARNVDEVHDLLRRIGDLSADEIAARTVGSNVDTTSLPTAGSNARSNVDARSLSAAGSNARSNVDARPLSSG